MNIFIGDFPQDSPLTFLSGFFNFFHKSSALDIYKKLGAATISSDEIVSELYKKKEVYSLIEKTLKMKFSTDTVNKDELRNHLILNPKDKKKLEKIIHPLVEKEIVYFLNTETNPIRVVEVPLLFEAKLDHYFDVITVIDINKNIQLERLQKRNGNKAILLEEINKTNKIDENKNKATYLIMNNGNISELEKEINRSFKEVKDLLR